MSSTDPFASLSGAERWTAPLDALRQRQKELASRIAQVQKAAQPLSTKTPPSPTATVPALHDKFTDQFNKASATVQQQQAAYKDAVAREDWTAAHGHLTAVRDAWQQLQGAGEITGAVLQFASKLEEAQKAELDAKARQHAYAKQSYDEIVQSLSDFMQDIRQKVTEMVEAQDQVASKIWS